jgi:DNA topoisomerase-3
MSYVCEKATGAAKTCDFRSGKLILQQPIEREQMKKLLETGKTNLLPKFISRKGRPFAAYLVAKDGKVSFEFEKRERKPGAKERKPREPQAKVDFTGQEPLGECPLCGGHVFETDTKYVCEKTQADKKPCKFKSGKVILQQPISREQMIKLLKAGRTDRMDQFISKYGKPFPAFLVLGDDGKVGFEFPPRDAQPSGDKVSK